MTKPVVTSHTDTMGRALAQPDVRNVSYTPRQTDCEFPQRAVLAYKHRRRNAGDSRPLASSYARQAPADFWGKIDCLRVDTVAR